MRSTGRSTVRAMSHLGASILLVAMMAGPGSAQECEEVVCQSTECPPPCPTTTTSAPVVEAAVAVPEVATPVVAIPRSAG